MAVVGAGPAQHDHRQGVDFGFFPEEMHRVFKDSGAGNGQFAGQAGYFGLAGWLAGWRPVALG